jgi:hypothetical protein
MKRLAITLCLLSLSVQVASAAWIPGCRGQLIATRSFALIDNILAIAAALSQSLPLRVTAQKLPSAAANSAA